MTAVIQLVELSTLVYVQDLTYPVPVPLTTSHAR
jgi:hypothetical protein